MHLLPLMCKEKLVCRLAHPMTSAEAATIAAASVFGMHMHNKLYFRKPEQPHGATGRHLQPGEQAGGQVRGGGRLVCARHRVQQRRGVAGAAQVPAARQRLRMRMARV